MKTWRQELKTLYQPICDTTAYNKVRTVYNIFTTASNTRQYVTLQLTVTYAQSITNLRLQVISKALKQVGFNSRMTTCSHAQ